MPSAQPRLDAATLATIDRWLAYRVWHSRVPGAQVAIGIGGEPVFAQGYGYADAERRVPMRTDHLFRVASHSKTFTATAILRLVERGRLGLEDRLGDHVPELDDQPIGASVLRELLEHTSGALRDGLDADYWLGARPFPDRAEVLEMARAAPKSDPGERFAYSNLGYGLLGLVIENVTDLSYAEAVGEEIIDPLGLADTAATYLPERADDYAAGHSALTTSTRRHRIDSVDTRAFDAATGFSSTAADLVRYFGAHAYGDDRLLDDRSKRLMQRRANATSARKPDGASYGLGMAAESYRDHRMTGHSGGYPGHVTRTLLDPDDGLVVAVLTNATDGPASLMAGGLLALIDAARDSASDPGSPAPSAERPEFGRWQSGWVVIDIGMVGPTVRAVQIAGWEPLDEADELEVAPDGFRIAAGSGYGLLGEPVRLQPDGSLRYGSMTMTRFTDLPEPADDLG